MIASRLRSRVFNRLKVSITSNSRVLPSTKTDSVRFISSENEKEFKSLGLLDEDGLTVFDTLHDMQVGSCKVYPENELFGTYDAESNSFKYMTYTDFDEKVNKCRTALKSLGEFPFFTIDSGLCNATFEYF